MFLKRTRSQYLKVDQGICPYHQMKANRKQGKRVVILHYCEYDNLVDFTFEYCD